MLNFLEAASQLATHGSHRFGTKSSAQLAQATKTKAAATRGGSVPGEVMKDRSADFLERVDVSAVQEIQIKGRHSDQNYRYSAERAQRLRKVDWESLNESPDVTAAPGCTRAKRRQLVRIRHNFFDWTD